MDINDIPASIKTGEKSSLILKYLSIPHEVILIKTTSSSCSQNILQYSQENTCAVVSF